MKRWEAQVLITPKEVKVRRFWTREGAYRWMYRNLPFPADKRREGLQWMARTYYTKSKRFEQWGTDYDWAFIRRVR